MSRLRNGMFFNLAKVLRLHLLSDVDRMNFYQCFLEFDKWYPVEKYHQHTYCQTLFTTPCNKLSCKFYA